MGYDITSEDRVLEDTKVMTGIVFENLSSPIASLFEPIMDSIEWIFSGIGTAIITSIVSGLAYAGYRIYKHFQSTDINVYGNTNSKIQIGRDHNIFIQGDNKNDGLK